MIQDLVKKLEKELESLDEECAEGSSAGAGSKILYQSGRGDVQMPAMVRKRDEEKV